MKLSLSHDPDFYRRIADQILACEHLISDFGGLIEKGKRLDIEFLEGDWPDFHADQAKLNRVTERMRALEPALTPDEISEVYRLLRSSLGYEQ